MKSWWMQSGPAGATLELRDVARPEPAAGQLLVRVHAAGLNRGEFSAGHAAPAAGGQGVPWKAIGGEAAGEVVAVGPGVQGFAPGDAVMGRCNGAFAEYVLMDTAEAMPRPAALSWEAAASLPLTWLVAFDMLVLQGGLRAGQWLLVNGVSSGVGVASLQLAKALQARVIGTSSAQHKLDALAPLGLDVGVCTRGPGFEAAVMAATQGQGVNLVVNAVGGSVFAEALRVMAFEGRLATVGHVDGVLRAEIDLEALHAKRLVVFGVSNRLRTKAQKSAAVPAFRAQVLPLFEQGRIRAVVDQVLDFDRLPEAKAHMEAGRHTGKIVLRVAG
ncbi:MULTISPECIES: zinc-binding dehydrogenase [Ramlibacter]|uniref:Zinc-binding dehydrogenase n=1 Tax=Ramlibacter aquaticus TaxID=2780094 RepID=A0ABR9SBT9_9BURK|nr:MULTISPECIES: zinc-binding dehydrogenase [Ramlibacter]MBE7939770.1 zinc-binding dehydrogenase [Ramlibacter aquaticus]